MSNPPAASLLVIERILRDRHGIWRQIIEESGLGRLTAKMLASSTLSLACYGVVLGASNSWQQAISSAVKLPLLFLATLAICLPTLYLFNLVFGARLSVLQAVALIFTSITVTAVLTLAFTPISLFFLITAHNYAFLKVVNIAILILTAVVGLRFLTEGMRALNEHQIRVAQVQAAQAHAAQALAFQASQPAQAQPAVVPAPLAPELAGRGQLPAGQRPASMSLLYIWILLFGFVGTQLAWTLRPFFGSPGEPFGIFRNLNGTFYEDLFTTIGRLLGS